MDSEPEQPNEEENLIEEPRDMLLDDNIDEEEATTPEPSSGSSGSSVYPPSESSALEDSVPVRTSSFVKASDDKPMDKMEEKPTETMHDKMPASFPPPKKNFGLKKLLVIVVSAVIVIILGIGVAAYFYQNKLNADQVNKRQAATLLNHMTIAFDTEYGGFYPETLNDAETMNYWNHFYEGLTSFNKDMGVQPQLALSWENPDSNTWRFRLRHDVTFHNGQKMTADDVVASFNAAIGNDNVDALIPTVESATKVDDYTVDIKTKSPTPILANLLPQVYVMPKTLVDSKDWSNPIGTGPYKIVSSKDSTFQLTRYDGYYGTKPKVKDVTLEAITDDTARLDAVKSGQVDVATEVSSTPAGTKDNSGQLIQFAASKPIGVIFLYFDSVRDKSPYITGVSTNPLKDVRVRQAMALALDVPAIMNSGDFNRFSEQATQIVPSTIFGYNSSIKPSSQNLDSAKSLMTQAGYSSGFSIVMDSARQLNYQAILKAQLAKINISLTIKYDDPSIVDYYSKLGSGDASMVSIMWTAPSGDALEAYENVLGQDGSINFFKVNDTQINGLITQCNSTMDLAKRKGYLEQMATIVDQQKYIIPLLAENTIYDYRQGLVVTPRADGTSLASEASGAIPANLTDYSYLDALKKLLHL